MYSANLSELYLRDTLSKHTSCFFTGGADFKIFTGHLAKYHQEKKCIKAKQDDPFFPIAILSTLP